MPITILITRPEPAGRHLADTLRAEFSEAIEVILSPVMAIEPVEAEPDFTGLAHLILTSRNGVTALAGLTERRDIPCLVIGEATAEHARSCGFRVTYVAEEANALVAGVIAQDLSGPCLHLRGEHTTGDIAGRLSKAGIATSDCLVYRQTEQPLSAKAIQCLGGNSLVILPLYSPRSARILLSQIRSKADLWVAAISANVAEALPEKEIGRLSVAETPDAGAMLAAIRDLVADAKALEGTYRAK